MTIMVMDKVLHYLLIVTKVCIDIEFSGLGLFHVFCGMEWIS